MKAINLGNISDRDLTRRAWDELHPKYQKQLQLDCLNSDTVLYEEFKDRLENIEKANKAVGIKWHMETRNCFYSQDNREDHQKDRWKKNTNKNYKNNNKSQLKNKNYNYNYNNYNK